MAYLEKTGAAMPLALALNISNLAALFQIKQGQVQKSGIRLADLFYIEDSQEQEFDWKNAGKDSWPSDHIRYAVLALMGQCTGNSFSPDDIKSYFSNEFQKVFSQPGIARPYDLSQTEIPLKELSRLTEKLTEEVNDRLAHDQESIKRGLAAKDAIADVKTAIHRHLLIHTADGLRSFRKEIEVMQASLAEQNHHEIEGKLNIFNEINKIANSSEETSNEEAAIVHKNVEAYLNAYEPQLQKDQDIYARLEQAKKGLSKVSAWLDKKKQ
jgi:hypothetical protein